MTPESCPRCGGLLQALQDADGPRLSCFMGCWQQDLLADTPEHLASLTQVAAQIEKQQQANDGQRDRRGRYQAHNVAGIRQRSGKKRPPATRRNPSWDNFKIGGEYRRVHWLEATGGRPGP